MSDADEAQQAEAAKLQSLYRMLGAEDRARPRAVERSGWRTFRLADYGLALPRLGFPPRLARLRRVAGICAVAVLVVTGGALLVARWRPASPAGRAAVAHAGRDDVRNGPAIASAADVWAEQPATLPGIAPVDPAKSVRPVIPAPPTAVPATLPVAPDRVSRGAPPHATARAVHEPVRLARTSTGPPARPRDAAPPIAPAVATASAVSPTPTELADNGLASPTSPTAENHDVAEIDQARQRRLKREAALDAIRALRFR